MTNEIAFVLRSARTRNLQLITALAIGLAAANTAHACTLCESPTAKIVRDRVMTTEFLAQAAELSLVFPLLLGAVALAGFDTDRTFLRGRR